jgi:hypothetical protein
MEPSPQPQSKAAGPGFSQVIRPLVFAVIACAVVIVLFSKAGIIYKHADLSFLVAPFIFYYVLRFLARLSTMYLPFYTSFRTALATASILNGLAFGLFVFLFLNNAEQLTNIGIFTHIKGFLTSLSATAGYVTLFVAGVTTSKLAGIIRDTASGKAFYPIVNALGQFLAGIGIWQFLAAFSGDSDILNKTGLVIFCGMLAVALANTGHYGEHSKNPFIHDASHWLIHSITLEFLIGGFIAIYFLFIRPAIIDAFRYAPFVELGIVCLIGWRLFSGIKNGIRTRSAVDTYEADWRKHIQIISNLQGADLPRLGEMQEIFIQDGGRDSLLIYLTLLLNNNKVSPEEIHRILHPLISYRDARMPWFAFGWEQRRLLNQNEANRRTVLGEIMADLKYIMNPANQKIEEHTNEKNQPG